MNRTQIEWVRNPDGSPGYTLNPMSGCKNHTPEGLCLDGLFPCYAYKLAHGRLKSRYLANHNVAVPCLAGWEIDKAMADPFYPRFWEERLKEIRQEKGRHLFPPRQRRGIFVCDMGDLFGIGVPEEWTYRVMQHINANLTDRFYLLTKQPQNLIKFSPFPENCYVGVTATNSEYLSQAFYVGLARIDATIKFVSFEPLLAESKVDAVDFKDCGINWLIIGACTGTEKEMSYLAGRHRPFLTEMPWGNKWTAQPSIEWVREIVQAADKAGIPVFLKDNLLELVNYHSPETAFAFDKDGCYRQEMPDPLIRERTKENRRE